MSRIFTYSFEDTTVTISHPNFETYSAYGSGIGQIAISYANDVTIHDVSADLAVVVSKAVRKNGTVTFTVLQSSDFNSWLNRFAAFIEQGNTADFALATMTITNNSTGDTYVCTGVTHQKRADNSFGAEAETKEWTLMCANILSK